MSDHNDDAGCVNRVRAMARMFEALAQVEMNGVHTPKSITSHNSAESLSAITTEEIVEPPGADDEEVNAVADGHRSMPDDSDANNHRDDNVADGHDIDTDKSTRRYPGSLVRRLANAFEQFAQTKRSSHLSQMTDDGMYLSLPFLEQRPEVESVDGGEASDDDGSETEHKSVASIIEDHVLDKASELNANIHTDEENQLIIMDEVHMQNESVLNDTEWDNFTTSSDRSVSPSLSSDSYPDLPQIADPERVEVDGDDDVDSAPECDNPEIVISHVEEDDADQYDTDHEDDHQLSDVVETTNPEILAADPEPSAVEEDDEEIMGNTDGSMIVSRAWEADTIVEPPASKVPHIIDELLTNEQNYIQILSTGIDIYVTVFDESSPDSEQPPLPIGLLGQKHHLFGNIERIRDFHANTFLPTLQQYDPTDVGSICEAFCRFCTEHSFYAYVLYAINSKRGSELAAAHRDFFAQRQRERGDRLGMNSFLLQPIQRLPRYQLLLNEVIKELAKRLDVAGVKEQIASCCRAEKHLKRLLEQVNSSMTINDVVDNSEINLLHQGKFRFLHKFDVYECASRRRYRGVLFLFDRGVLVSEQLDAKTLQYRGFFSHTRIGMLELDYNCFALLDQWRNVRLVELMTEMNAAVQWMTTLAEIAQGRNRIGSSARSTVLWRDSGISDDTLSIGTQQSFVVVRNGGQNGGSAVSSASTAWSSGVSGMSDETVSGRSIAADEGDTGRTTSWYLKFDANLVRKGKTLERLFNSEKHFIQILSNYKQRYIDVLPSNRIDPIQKYVRSVQILIDFHRYIHYPKLMGNRQDIVAVCEAFRAALVHPTYLQTYQMYAATCTRAYAMLNAIHASGEGAELRHYTGVPLEHLDRTNAFMNHLMYELKDADATFVSDEFKAVAVLHVELHRFVDRVRDNLNLNSIKNENTNFEEDYGLVESGEPCSIYGYKTRLLLLTRGLVCVRTRISTKTQREKFTSVEFQMPRSAVRTMESNRSKARMKFFASFAKDVVFKVDFPTVVLKQAMQKRINVFGNMDV